MSSILAILAIAVTSIATLTAVVFVMAMGANATPAQIRTLKRWMAGLALLGAGGIAGAIVLLCDGQPGRASLAAMTPVAAFLLLFVVALRRPSP